jgi:hypothetical protein
VPPIAFGRRTRAQAEVIAVYPPALTRWARIVAGGSGSRGRAATDQSSLKIAQAMSPTATTATATPPMMNGNGFFS